MPSNAYSNGWVSVCGASNVQPMPRKRGVRCLRDGPGDSGKRTRGGQDAGGRFGEESTAARRPSLGKHDAGTVRDAGVEQSVRRNEAFELAGNAATTAASATSSARAYRAGKPAQDHREIEAEHGPVSPIVGHILQMHARRWRVAGRKPDRKPRLHGGSALGERGRISESLRAPGQPLQIIAGNFR